jgi:outer membrane protein
MRKWTFVLMALLTPLALQAQTKIGIMDFDRAVVESERGKVVQAELVAYQTTLAAEIEATQDQLAGAQQRQQTGQRVLNEAALQELSLTIERLTRQLNRQIEDAELEMQLKQQDLFNPVLDELATVVEEFVDAEGFTLILPPDAVIYAAEETNITQQIIDRYNASPAGAATAPATTTPPAAPEPPPPAAPATTTPPAPDAGEETDGP